MVSEEHVLWEVFTSADPEETQKFLFSKGLTNNVLGYAVGDYMVVSVDSFAGKASRSPDLAFEPRTVLTFDQRQYGEQGIEVASPRVIMDDALTVMDGLRLKFEAETVKVTERTDLAGNVHERYSPGFL